MAITKELVQFRSGSPRVVLNRMEQMRARGDGREWLNLQPWVDEERMPKVSVWRHLFSSRGFSVPTATWVPGHPGADPPDVTQVGLIHPGGHRALGSLADADVGVPDGWVAVQDHTRRGLVFVLRDGDDDETALDFLFQATRVLAPELDVDDRWIAGFVTQT